ncbi:type II secretion system protein GspM [uncultured Sphingomonas sp.]|uniref:type II secretion system protein GspM n=1 Tax=uncultured Sphingomonas sp. TaxID=158754 RepID=UPI0035C9EDEE
MSSIRAWFDGRALREKRLILVMLALLALTLVWYGVINPVGDALSGERSRYADAVERLGATEAQVAAIRGAERDRPPPLTGRFADAVRARAADAGFTVASLTEEGADRVRVGIASAKPAALLRWLARLELAGILVDGATLTDNGDRTVGVQVTLKARGA